MDIKDRITEGLNKLSKKDLLKMYGFIQGMLIAESIEDEEKKVVIKADKGVKVIVE